MTPEFAVAATSAAAVSPDTLALVRTTMQAAVLSAWIQAGATLAVGLGQAVLIWLGLRQMRTASATRDRQLDNQHAATMRALEQQGVALATLSRGLEQQGATLATLSRGLEQQGTALAALVERTGKGQSA